MTPDLLEQWGNGPLRFTFNFVRAPIIFEVIKMIDIRVTQFASILCYLATCWSHKMANSWVRSRQGKDINSDFDKL